MLIIEGVCKQYGNVKALDHLNMHALKGEIYGFVGPNGAGKTTTIKIITGLTKADQGTVMVDGVDTKKYPYRVKEKIGYMPDFFGVYDNLKVIEYLEFYTSIYKTLGKKERTFCYELLELVRLEDKAEQYVDHLSRGMKQRLCLARTLVNRPELLVLDEPASGLDPRARRELQDMLRGISSSGVTILTSSHILSELSELCTTIGIIEQGKLVLEGKTEDIFKLRKLSTPLLIQFLEQGDLGIQIIRENPLTKKLSKQGNCVSVTFEGDEKEEGELLYQLVSAGIPITSFYREKNNLETLFMQITKGEEGYEDESHLS